MKICKNCGMKYDDNQRFCEACGTLLEELPIQQQRSKGKKKAWVWILVCIIVAAVAGGGAFAVYTIRENKIEASEKNTEKKGKKQKESEKKVKKQKEEAKEDEAEKQAEAEKEKASQAEQEQPKAVTDSAITRVTATSILVEKKITHSADRIMDGDPATAWVEGAKGQGENEGVTFYFDGDYQVNGFIIKAGYHKSAELYQKNSRPAEIKISDTYGSCETYLLQDVFAEQNIKLIKPMVTDNITVTILSVYPGSTFEDTVISEIHFY